MSAAIDVYQLADKISLNNEFLKRLTKPTEIPNSDKSKKKQIILVASVEPKKYIVGGTIEGTTLSECHEKFSGKELKCQKIIIAEVAYAENDDNRRSNRPAAKNKVIIAEIILTENDDQKSSDKHNGINRMDSSGSIGQLEAHMRVAKSIHVAFPIDLFLDNGSQFLVFDKGHGNMHAHIKDLRQILPELDAKALFYQMVEAVADCHSAGIILNDMKLRRFIFSNAAKTNLCIENLDGCILLQPGESDDKNYAKKGNPFYISPEAVRAGKGGHYKGKPSDVWSLGIMMYTMLCGKYPFQDANPIVHLSKVIGGKYTTPDDMSRSAKCLIGKMLNKDPKERLTAKELLHHPWFDAPIDTKKSRYESKMSEDLESEDDRLVPSGSESDGE